MSIAADIRAGAWVRFPSWEQWRHVTAARHTPLSPAEPRGTGFVQYDCLQFGGFAEHDWTCQIITVTPQAVTA